MITQQIAQSDLDEILEWASDDIRAFAGQRICITGGMGFVGKWLRESIDYANLKIGTNIGWFVLREDGTAIASGNSYGDERIDAIIWGSHSDPPETDKPLLYLSSGAVYYEHHRPEIAAEKQRGESIVRRNPNAKVARMFSFIGPHLGEQYLATQLVRQRVPIVNSPFAVRSWMYPTDMVRQLWRLFANRGTLLRDIVSDDYRTVGELATLICRERGVNWVPGGDFSSYRAPRPSPHIHVPLEEAVRRTVAFYAA